MTPPRSPCRAGTRVPRSLPLVAVALLLIGAAAAQVRFDLRNGGQIQGQSRYAVDWPLDVNQYAHGDVDGDGDLDLLAALNRDGGRVWFNDGDGAFLRYQELPGDGKRCAAFVDVDADGDLDVFLGGGNTTYGSAASCQLWRNDGLGTFTASPTLPGGPYYNIEVRSLGVGDVDGDGDPDLVLFQHNAGVLYWQNDGTGTFTDQTTAAGLQGMTPYGSRVGRLCDIDGDGDLDALTVWGNANRLYRNDGAGHFAPDPNWNRAFLEVADVDGDGDVDLLTPGVLRNDGAGIFTALGSVPSLIASEPDRAWDSDGLTLADFDGDGRRDLVASTRTTAPFLLRDTGGFVFQDVSATWFEPEALVRTTRPYQQSWAWVTHDIFDVDGDGDPDLVTGGTEQLGATSNTIGIPPKVCVNAARQALVRANRPAFPFLQDAALAMAAGDLDGDGDIDLVCEHAGYHQVPGWRWFTQDRFGRFVGESRPIPIPMSAVCLFDADGDGDLDVFGVAGSGPMYPGGNPGPHGLALNDGLGNFTNVTATHLPATAFSSGGSCAAGDVDGDGDLDIVVGSYDPNYNQPVGVPLMLLRNDGTGHFTDASSQLPATPCQSGHTALADLDRDGDLDLVAANDRWHYGPVPLVLFLNDGAGNFTDVTAARVPAVAAELQVVDLDGDGDLDLAQAGWNLINDGTGTFTATAAVQDRLAIADFDEDGILDLLVGQTWVQSPGGATFFGAYGSHGIRLLVADLDGDGDRDLVAAPLHGWTGTDWTTMRIDVLHNLRRDLRAATLPRAGQPLRLRLRAGNGTASTLAFTALSFARLAQPIGVPGFGDLWLDPAALGLLPLAVVPDADTAVEVSVPIPALASFVGVEISAQAFFVPAGNTAAARLSNVVTNTIAP